MRAMLLLSVAAMVCLPLAAANPVPVLAIRLDQSAQNVNATNASQPVVFTGEVAIDKSAFLSATVTLEGSVDKGWQTDVSPASMTFTTTDPQAFRCTVVVPAATPGDTVAQLTINGTIVSGLLQSIATTTAVINVIGTSPPPTNQTGNNTNGTKPSNGNNQTVIPPGLSSNQITAGFLGYSNEQWLWIAVVAVAVTVAAVAVVRVRRRRKAVHTVDEAAYD